MAKICELVYLKFDILFGDPGAIQMQERILEELENVLGTDITDGITPAKATKIGTYLANTRPDYRIVGIEWNEEDTGLNTKNWETYAETYSPEWIFEALNDIPADRELILTFADSAYRMRS